MRYIVTGVDGRVCGRTADEMLKLADPRDLIFTCPDLSRIRPENRKRWEDAGVALRAADYDNPESLKAAFAGGDRMFMISTLDIKKRVQQHKNAIDAAMAAGVQHISYPGVGEEGLAKEAYSTTYVAGDHLATDAYIKECKDKKGLRYTSVRPNMYVENYTTFWFIVARLLNN